MTDTIQQLKEDINILQMKLKKLEELEIQKSKSPVEKAFYRVYGYYPTLDGEYKDSPWQRFAIGYNAGYNAGYDDVKGNNKNFEPTSQTPEQVEQGLRDPMKQAKEDGVFEKPKPQTLLDIVCEWCDDDNDLPCEELVNRIKKWLPDEFDPNEAYEIGWNDALRTIKEKLR